MHEINLRGIDLNLLMILRALLREQSVTRAAQVLNMSQPAVSHALNRLRHVFGDVLLVRVGHKMALTARAESIASDIDRILNDIAHVIERRAFDPATAVGGLSICATEGAIGVILDALLEIQRQAPKIVLEISSEVQEAREGLKSGRIDLYMDSHPPLQESGFVSVGVLRNRLKCVAAKGTLRSDPMSREEYEERGHAVVSGGTEDQIAHYLRGQGIHRKVSIVTPGYFTAARVASRSDLILTLPEALAESACRLFPLEAVGLPVLSPEVSLSLSWHIRKEGDPLHRWAREIIIDATKGFGKPEL